LPKINMKSELKLYFKSQQSAFCTMEDKKRELVDAALKKAKETLMDKGFSEDAIQIKHETMDEGFTGREGCVGFYRKLGNTPVN